MSAESFKPTENVGNRRQHFSVYLKGIAMGMGDSVPGISGGTIAVITGIYDKLIFSIRAVDVSACRLLLQGKFAVAWQYVNGSFLLLLALGILTGLIVSANTVLYLLENYFEALMAFFIGLVLASSWLLRQQFNYRAWQNLLALALGISVTVSIGLLPAAAGNVSPLAIFCSGAIAICAMILPGLSGAFILLLLGVYEFVLTALIEINLPIIVLFMAGCIVGLLAFSRLLAWLLRHHHQLSYGFIIGMLLGSLSVLWPWQQALTYYTDSSGEQHVLQSGKLWPAQYAEVTGQDPVLLLVVVCVGVGLAVVAALHYFATTLSGKASAS